MTNYARDAQYHAVRALRAACLDRQASLLDGRETYDGIKSAAGDAHDDAWAMSEDYYDAADVGAAVYSAAALAAAAAASAAEACTSAAEYAADAASYADDAVDLAKAVKMEEGTGEY